MSVRTQWLDTSVLEVTAEHVDRALRIARSYAGHARRADVSDLEGAALEGLARAARDWDPARSNDENDLFGGHAFWKFAHIKILGQMRDELRRFDHLTRNQRACVVTDDAGGLLPDQKALAWVDPQEPASLDATIVGEAENGRALVDLVEEARDQIEEFELRDVFRRATVDLSPRERLLFVKRELEGYSNGELARALSISEGRASQLQNAGIGQMRRQIGDSLVDAA
jgi:RNA polymerase sigma factor (sigma-70 family)